MCRLPHPSCKSNITTMKKLILIIVLLVGATAFKCSSVTHITGIVYDDSTKQPMPGVSVKIEGANNATATNGSGAYSIDVADSSSNLTFSFIGYQKRTVKIGKKTSINVYLRQTQRQLNEVVATGYGTAGRQDMAASVSTVQPAAPVAANAFQGKVAGVFIRGSASQKKYKTPVINSADPGDESYKSNLENGFSSVKDNPLSTFSTDVDAASYSNVRRYINNGELPPKDAVRVEEMINYFSYNLAGPTNADPVAIHTELSAAPWNPKHRLLRIGLKAKTIDESHLPPSNLVFLLDVSGSMADANKLPLVKSAMKMLVDKLRPQDRVAIVVYSGQAGLKLPSTAGDHKETIKDAIDALYADGSTAGGAGIKMAYRIARQNFMPNGNNRIIMATDGDFNVGDSSDGDMETLISRERDSHVALSIMGVGMGNLKDSKMETLADKGNGNYAYIDNITEARKTLIEDFGGTLFTVAKDVKLQVEFNPAAVQSYRLLGYEDRMLNKEDFNNDKKDAGDMGSGHTVTAFYEVIPTGVKDDYNSVDPLKYQKNDAVRSASPNDELMTIKFRYKQPDGDVSKMVSTVVKNTPKSFNQTTADFRFAAAVAEFGMLIKDSQFKQQATFDQAISIAKTAKADDRDGYRSEFVRLAESAQSLAKTELVSKE